jgi:antitoxin (DNA-binding transcriptional repressor) of toxin-antitoxin stability system
MTQSPIAAFTAIGQYVTHPYICATITAGHPISLKAINMKHLGVREMRASYDVLQETLAQEGEVILTHHGKPFARVLPYAAPTTQMPDLKAFRARQKRQTVPTAVVIRQDRDAR